MNKTLLIVGIIITGISLLTITIFSISNSILKKVNKEKELAKTTEQKSRDKAIKRILKYSKKIIKKVNKALVENYVALYAVTAVTFTGGAVLTTVSAVKVVEEKNASTSVEPTSSSSSEPSSSSESSSIYSSTSSEPVSYCRVTFYKYEDEYEIAEVIKGNTIIAPEVDPDPGDPDYGFRAWSTSPDEPIDFDFNTPITSDISLYAEFAHKCTITFKDGNDVYDTQTVLVGNKATFIPYIHESVEVPCKWTLEDQMEETEFNFNTIITTDIAQDYLLTLYLYLIPTNNTNNNTNL